MRIYNSQTHQKQELVPLEDGHIRIYCCGPTVYNYFHIGNARPFVIFDTLRRYLESTGLKVSYVQNFTDIDDKMIRRAAEENTTVAELGDRYIEAYFEDAAKLNIRPATVHPRATRHIGDMIGLIRKLEKKGLAYAADGDVYFDTQAYPGYGALSGQSLEELESGARIEPGERKRHPMDFALWKAQKKGEPAWPSPWGLGRPGWHIECSAMSMKYLGETMDIHCGGEDLLFPHHENEVAQSQGATGKPFARYWMHNGFIQVNNHKMSKSLGNFFTVRDVLATFDGEVIRLFLLSAHYRSPLQFSQELMEGAKSALDRLYNCRDNLFHALQSAPKQAAEGDQAFIDKQLAHQHDFVAALEDDLNTATAIGALFELVRTLNAAIAAGAGADALSHGLKLLQQCCGILGILQHEATIDDPRAQELLEARAKARQARDYALSDQLRDELKALGYAVEDTPQGQKLRRSLS
nr:cysteine--tRNA ligase [bacterium]